eukprot:COSAG04_NODE_537_length_12906_cov_3.938705_6_plen_135_part_00
MKRAVAELLRTLGIATHRDTANRQRTINVHHNGKYVTVPTLDYDEIAILAFDNIGFKKRGHECGYTQYVALAYHIYTERELDQLSMRMFSQRLTEMSSRRRSMQEVFPRTSRRCWRSATSARRSGATDASTGRP